MGYLVLVAVLVLVPVKRRARCEIRILLERVIERLDLLATTSRTAAAAATNAPKEHDAGEFGRSGDRAALVAELALDQTRSTASSAAVANVRSAVVRRAA